MATKKRTSPASKTVRSGKPPRGEQKIPTLPPRPSPPGEGTDWRPICRYDWPMPRKWR
jgi:hypothetical protein